MKWYAAKVGLGEALVDGETRIAPSPVATADKHILIEARSHEVFGQKVSYNPLSERVFVFDQPLAWPTPARTLTDGFGPRKLDGADNFHSGIDFPVPAGTQVRAVLPGKVHMVGYDPAGFGRFVVLDHGNGLFSLYAHLTIAKVATGELVAAGDLLALSGASGNARGPHLHFAMYATGARFPLLQGYIFNKEAAIDPWPLF
ncbi:MAG: M23 family metallopeptidase [Bacillota bacterium]